MGSIGAPELIIVLLVVLLLFGSTKLPKLARSIGEASKEFKKGVSEGAGESADVPTAPAASAPTTTAAPAAPAAPATGGPDDRVTMTRAELEALLAEREAQARKDVPPAV
jgi:sec-independent protein translocase protein TatA